LQVPDGEQAALRGEARHSTCAVEEHLQVPCGWEYLLPIQHVTSQEGSSRHILTKLLLPYMHHSSPGAAQARRPQQRMAFLLLCPALTVPYLHSRFLGSGEQGLVGEIPGLVRYVDHRHHRLGGWIGLAEGAAEDVLKGLQALAREEVGLPVL